MIYGYKLKEINEIGLLEMKEITFLAPSDVLREIARFLEDMAHQIDEGTLLSSHRHIGSVIVGWDKRFPDKDIIVIPPAASSDDTSNEE
jgi:hypothetical protein